MNNLPDDQNPRGANPVQPPAVPPVPGLQKEHEVAPQSETARLEELVAEMELEPEVEQAGLEQRSETITLPEDVRQLGVEATGEAQPVATQPVGPELPLSDEKIEQGLHARIWSSFRWFAVWCVRQLQKAHFHLKKIGNRIIRERDS